MAEKKVEALEGEIVNAPDKPLGHQFVGEAVGISLVYGGLIIGATLDGEITGIEYSADPDEFILRVFLMALLLVPILAIAFVRRIILDASAQRKMSKAQFSNNSKLPTK